jgi:hypothetical protein
MAIPGKYLLFHSILESIKIVNSEFIQLDPKILISLVSYFQNDKHSSYFSSL